MMEDCHGGAHGPRTAGEDERRLAEATAAVLLLQREAAAHRAELELKAGEAALLQRQLLDVRAKLPTVLPEPPLQEHRRS